LSQKPRLFLGSSSEGLPHAQVIEAHLAKDFEVRLWTQGLFLPGHYPLESLEAVAKECMFAVIVGTDDDVLTKRGTTSRAIRDNLVFEFGLFFGLFGRKRTILVTPKRVALALPSDLDGLTRATYSRRAGPPTSKAWMKSLHVVAVEISKALLKEMTAERAQRARQHESKRQARRQQAALRLYRAVTQLRDLFIELPTNALGAIGKKSKFDKVKQDASKKVRNLEKDWHDDAELLGVVPQLDALASATSRALLAFPYPTIHVTGDEATEVAGRLLARVKSGTPTERLGAAAKQVGDEVERKVAEFANMYKDWWAKHAPVLRERAYALQDRVTNGMVGDGR